MTTFLRTTYGRDMKMYTSWRGHADKHALQTDMSQGIHTTIVRSALSMLAATVWGPNVKQKPAGVALANCKSWPVQIQ